MKPEVRTTAMKTQTNKNTYNKNGVLVPEVGQIEEALSQAESMDDFFGKEGILAQLFARTLEQMLEGELTAELGYEKYEAKGRNSGTAAMGNEPRR